jgi:hypothetical protein
MVTPTIIASLCARLGTKQRLPHLSSRRLKRFWAHSRCLGILGDRDLEQHEDTARWIGGVFDPKGFDLNRLTKQ